MIRTLPQDISLDAWVTSDNHWEHPRIREYQGRPDHHFVLMQEKWYELVQPDDVILHLGDLVCFGDKSRHAKWIENLPGTKYLMLGNHDYYEQEWYEQAGFTVLGRGSRPYLLDDPRSERLVAFSHEPITNDRFVYGRDDQAGSWAINVHGHTHGNLPWDPLPNKTYVNVSVEVTDYAPVRIGDVVRQPDFV